MYNFMNTSTELRIWLAIYFALMLVFTHNSNKQSPNVTESIFVRKTIIKSELVSGTLLIFSVVLGKFEQNLAGLIFMTPEFCLFRKPNHS